MSLNSQKEKRRFERGYTLVEVLVVAAITVVIAAAAATFARDIFSQNSMIRSGAIAEEGMRSVLRQFIGELRSSGQALTGAYAIETAGTSTIIFYSDIDNDGLRERVRYFLSAGNFKKGVVKPTGQPYVYNLANEQIRLVAPNVINGQTTVFYYYDSNYTGTTSPLTVPVNVSKIRLVKVEIGIDPNPARPLQPMWLSSQVMIRSLKDNM